jgi:hypothetical protein
VTVRARSVGVELIANPARVAWDIEGPAGFPLGIRAGSVADARADFLSDHPGRRWSDFALAGWRVVPVRLPDGG